MPQPQTTQRGDDFFTTLASRPPFSRLDPALAAFFKDYLSHEKARLHRVHRAQTLKA